MNEIRKTILLTTTKKGYEFGKDLADESGMTFSAFVSSLYNGLISELMNHERSSRI